MILVVVPWFVMIYHYNGVTKFETLQYVMSEGGQDRPAYSNRFQPIPVYYLVEMTWPFNDISCSPYFAADFCFRLVRFGVVCLPKKKTGHLFPHMVCGGLRFLHINSQQAVALCYSAFPDFSHFRRMLYNVSLQQSPRVEAQARWNQEATA